MSTPTGPAASAERRGRWPGPCEVVTCARHTSQSVLHLVGGVARPAVIYDNAHGVGGLEEFHGRTGERVAVSSLTPFLAPGGDGHEEIELFGDTERLFGCRHVPDGGASAGVVLCPALFGDAEVNYHREARLARWLARAGAAVQRFHPRGVGRSDGTAADVSFSSLVNDARRAADQLCERCRLDRVAFLGTRVGGLVAARAARDVDDAPLALWQPVVDPRRYVDHSVAVGASVLGTPLGRELFESGAVDNLVDTVGVRPRAILLVQLHRRVGLASEYRTAVGRWRARDFEVEVAYDPTEDDWWRVHPGWQPSDEVLAVTALWLSSHLAVRE